MVAVGELPADAKKRGTKVNLRLDFLFHFRLAIPPEEKALAKLDRDDYVIIRWPRGGIWQMSGDWPKRADTKPTPPGPHVYEPHRPAYWYWTWEDLTEAPLTIDLVNKRTKETAKVTLPFSAVAPAKGG